MSGFTVAGRLRARVSSSGVTGGLPDAGTASALGVDLVTGFIGGFEVWRSVRPPQLLKNAASISAARAHQIAAPLRAPSNAQRTFKHAMLQLASSKLQQHSISPPLFTPHQ